ncbi:MAG: isoprenylcysteine carboxylmethyltransferase family protein [Clostridia bacterium]
MTDKTKTIAEIKKHTQDFSNARGWRKRTELQRPCHGAGLGTVKKQSWLAQVISILALPGMAMVVVPLVILFAENSESGGTGLRNAFTHAALLMGSLLILGGSCLTVITIWMHIAQGKGTLAPWSPSRILLKNGPYRIMRNPMITGVVLVLYGQAMAFWSLGLVVWASVFFLVNHLYFIILEEKALSQRFGEEYGEYKKDVSRWMPGGVIRKAKEKKKNG